MASSMVYSMARSTRERQYSTNPKVEELRYRAMARRQGLFLKKSSARDPHGLLYGRWWLYELVFHRSAKTGQPYDQILRYGGSAGLPDLKAVETVLTWEPKFRRTTAEAFDRRSEYDKPDKVYDKLYQKLVSMRPSN